MHQRNGRGWQRRLHAAPRGRDGGGGAYRVEIQGFKEVPRNENAVPGLAGVPDSKVQILPPHYNTASELERMVEPGRTFEINFDLE